MAKSFGGIFDFEGKKERLEEVNLELENPELWNNPDIATKISKEKSVLDGIIGVIEGLDAALEDAAAMLELAVEDAEHVFERVAVRQLARPVVDHVAAPRAAPGDLGYGKKRLLGGVSEDRENGHARPEVDGIVAPLAGGDPHAVKVQQSGQFSPVE